MRRLPLAVLAPALIALAACSSGNPATSASAPPPAAVPASTAAAKGCTGPRFDYLVRTTEPGLAASAQEIGNCDLATGQDALATFTATAGTASGECTTIAKASANPGYNPDASPAPKLKHVLMAAGPGC